MQDLYEDNQNAANGHKWLNKCKGISVLGQEVYTKDTNPMVMKKLLKDFSLMSKIQFKNITVYNIDES